ncbi:hypothetical protein FACS1894152_4620 [Bacilli bacterium]|nr:hypothetical protein FACS1894152_4620 [Bacilli bacterium]
MTDKRKVTPIEKIVFDSEEMEQEKKQNFVPRKPNDLQKLFEKKVIDTQQLYAGERLALDYENSFHNDSSTGMIGRNPMGRNKPITKKDSDNRCLIQNLISYERYHRAIMSISNPLTRDIVAKFCVWNIGLTKLDKELGNKRGEAETRLWYGLKELAKFYEGVSKEYF